MWINFNYDTHKTIPLTEQSLWIDQMDLNVSYSQKEGDLGNLPITKFCNWGEGSLQEQLKKSASASKEKSVVFYSEICTSRGALSFAKSLKNQLEKDGIKLDLFGPCFTAEESKDNSKQTPEELLRTFSQYKFALIIEGDFEEDFVGEQVFIALLAGILPLYKGATNIATYLPDESFLHLPSYSLTELSSYIKNMKEEEYSRYFAWKSRRSFMEILTPRVSKCALASSCRLCEQVARLQANHPDYAWNNDVERNGAFALHFDGTSFLEVGQLRLQDYYTIAFWFYLEEIEDYRLIDKNTAGRVDGYSVDVLKKSDRGFLRFCSSGGCWMGMKPLKTGAWYHGAVSFLSSRGAASKYGGNPACTFYINGKLDYVNKFPRSPTWGVRATSANTLPLRLGRAGEGENYYKGFLDEISLWSVLLTEKEVRKLVSQRLGGNEPNLIAYWGFNEGQGSLARDYGKNKQDAVLFGSLSWVPSESKEIIFSDCV